jgi:hypothetical protein
MNNTCLRSAPAYFTDLFSALLRDDFVIRAVVLSKQFVLHCFNFCLDINLSA